MPGAQVSLRLEIAAGGRRSGQENVRRSFRN